jgi:DNA-binding MarR family transcriptional regulator
VEVTELAVAELPVAESVWSIVCNLHRIAQVQRRAAAQAPFGPVALGLLNLAAQAPVRPSAAAAELGVPAQSITRAVAELVEAGLVAQVGSTQDGRSYTVELTRQGRAARTAFRRRLTEEFGRHLAGWRAGEIATFARQLDRLAASLAATAPAVDAAPARNPWRPQS